VSTGTAQRPAPGGLQATAATGAQVGPARWQPTAGLFDQGVALRAERPRGLAIARSTVRSAARPGESGRIPARIAQRRAGKGGVTSPCFARPMSCGPSSRGASTTVLASARRDRNGRADVACLPGDAGAAPALRHVPVRLRRIQIHLTCERNTMLRGTARPNASTRRAVIICDAVVIHLRIG